jgi:hypothetical protein
MWRLVSTPPAVQINICTLYEITEEWDFISKELVVLHSFLSPAGGTV